VMLPDINGKEVCQRVRSDRTMDDVKIICISGMVEENRISDLLASGANDFLRKPFDVEMLLKRICHFLDMEMVR
ncbi:MAG: response regulator, partial [Planctomycetia bacterium]|nr:response regulator [Planctomycetia bacterium]